MSSVSTKKKKRNHSSKASLSEGVIKTKKRKKKSSKEDKLQKKWNWFRSLGPNAKYIMSPMVGQSELAFRMLSRQHGVGLCYTPMFISSLFVESKEYRERIFTTCAEDRPLVVQFCGNNPQTLLAAARLVEDRCDAVDLNLGCPQEVARRGGYGAHMMKEWLKIDEILRTLVKGLSIPVTCKIRIFPEFHKTLAYAKVCQDAGVSLLTVHGRELHQKEEVLADWSVLARLKAELDIPVVANGDLWHTEDVRRCRQEVQPDGFMSAQGLLHNPALFEPLVLEDKQAEAALLLQSQTPDPETPAVAQDTAASTAAMAPVLKKTSLNKYRSRKTKPKFPLPSSSSSSTSSDPLQPPTPTPDSKAGAPSLSVATTGVLGTSGTVGPLAPYMRRRRQVGPTTAPTLCYSFAGARDPSAQTTASSSAAASSLGSSGNSISAGYSTAEDVYRHFQLAREYLQFAERYPPCHSSVFKRHVFLMLLDCFNANLDLYAQLCDVQTTVSLPHEEEREDG